MGNMASRFEGWSWVRVSISALNPSSSAADRLVQPYALLIITGAKKLSLDSLPLLQLCQALNWVLPLSLQ